MKFAANCATSLRAPRVELALRSPVMFSAHEACVGLWLAGARHSLGPQKIPCPAGALAFLDKVEGPPGCHARIWPTRCGRTQQPRHAWPGSILSNPAMKIWFYQPGRMVRSSKFGKSPRTNSSLRSPIPSRLRNLRSRRNLGSPCSRGHRSPCSRRSLDNHSHGPPECPWPPPYSPCRTHKTSPD